MTDGHLNRIDEEGEENEGKLGTESSEESIDGVGHLGPTAVKSVPEITLDLNPTRECVVCLGLITRNRSSIQPCPCGFWVHCSCLVSGVQTYEAEHPGCSPLGCRFCMNTYNITPKKGIAFMVLDRIAFRYNQFCKLGYHAISVMFFDSSFTIVGMAILFKIYGFKETEEMLLSKDPIKAVAMCKAIPLVSIFINFIPWETLILRSLRRCSGLPVVGKLFPTHDRRIREVRYRRTLFGVLVGGLMLPWYACFFGTKVFGFSDSRLSRFLLGGATFLALKGGFKMYYRQRQYARQCLLSVETYTGND